MNKQVFLIGVAVSGLVNGVYVLADGLDNTKEDTKQIQQPVQSEAAPLNENPLFEKYRLYIPTGKPKVFSSEKDIVEANTALQRTISLHRFSLVGKFDQKSKSGFIENEEYQGGGYHLVDFKITRYLREIENPVSIMSIRVPVAFIKLSDQAYLSENESSMNQLLAELKLTRTKQENGEITTEELDTYKIEWKEKIKALEYVGHFRMNIRRGSNYSLTDNTFVLFLNFAFDKGVADTSTYTFRPVDILPIGYGTYVDLLLPINNSELNLQHEDNE